jgi:tRNA A-37 threonylcarbamoyl transferase component Bud32
VSAACPHCGSAVSILSERDDGGVCCPACRGSLNLAPGPAPLHPGPDSPPATGPYLGPTTSEAPATPQPASLGDGSPPPGYEILEELGRGGMGVVYRARQLKANRIVALKMILAGGRAGEAERSRFQREAEAVAQLNHPGIVHVYEVGEWESQPHFALEYCPGGTLAAKLAGTPLLAPEAAALLERLAEAVAAAHGAGVVHRDLKPANVLLAADGTPKIADFGLALRLDSDDRQTRTGAVMGTPSYMAPEQALGQTRRIGPAADVYALGAVLYEVLTGRPPFKSATVLETLDQVRRQEPVPPRRLNPQVPRDLETICLRCLRKEPEKRYPGARELAEDLARFREGRPVVARPVGGLERTAKWVRRNPVVSILAALVVLSVLAGLAAFVWQFRKAIVNEELAEKKAEDATTAEAQAIREKAEATKQKTIAEDRAAKLRVALEDRERALSASERSRANGLLAQAEQAWKAGHYRIAQELHDDVPKESRGWAWNCLERQFQGGLFTAYGNRGPVAEVAFSPDGSVLAAVDAVWEFPAGRQRFRVSVAAAGLPEVAFSADGRLVAATDVLGRRTAFDAATGRPASVPPDFRPAVGPASPVSPDGSLFALPEHDQLHLVALRPEPPELERRRAATRTDLGWQNRQAARHEAAKNWFAALVHLNVLLRERPADENLKARRAKAAAALAEWDGN